MKAILYEAFGQRPKIATVVDPEPKARGVVVAVGATGICRSDWHAWRGHDSSVTIPHVPGHEFSGTVVEVGREVTRWKKGDRVTTPFSLGCGRCQACNAGNQHICDAPFQPGFNAWGSFAEYVAIDYADANLVELPENMAFSTAASLGCRFITSFRAVIDQGRVKPGEWVAVHGCGGVGLSAIMIAHAAGAKVVAVDIRREKLALAQSLGAQVLLDASVIDDIPSAIRDQTGGGAHLSIEGLGHSNTIMNSILGTRKRGRHIQVGLAMGSHANPPVPMLEVVANEIEIIGSLGMQAHRYDAVLRLIDSGSLKLSTLIGEEIGIDAAIDALVDLDLSEQAGVTVITRF